MYDFLNGMSVEKLQAVAKAATDLARDLKQRQPTYALALAAGIHDNSYTTVRYGHVPSYSGQAEIVLSDGSRWLAIGHGPAGDAHTVSRDGYIEFRPLED